MIATIASPFQSSLTTSVCCTFKVFVLLIFLNRCRCGCPELASSVTPQKKCLICSNYAWKTDALMENARWNRFSRVPIQTQFLITRRARRWLKQRQRCRQRNVKKASKQHLCKCSTLFLYISLPSLRDYHVKIPEATYYGGRWIFLSPTRLEFNPQEFNLNTGYGPEEFNSRKFTYIWASDKVGVIAMKIERKQIYFYVAFSLLSPVPIRGS